MMQYDALAPETGLQAAEAAEAAQPTLSSRLPSLDGWRALSILMVLCSHSVFATGFPEEKKELFRRMYWLYDGHLGVRFFFVISGFLITWLMLKEEKHTGTVSLRSFYIRRSLRILPVYWTYLAVVALLQYFTPFHHDCQTWIRDLTFTNNWKPPLQVTSHLWSLAVEEQFYLLWPAIFVFFKPQQKLGRMLGIFAFTIVVAIANRIIWRFSSETPLLHSLFSERSFFNNVDSLCLGCVLAVLLMHYQRTLRSLLQDKPLRVLFLGTALILLPKGISLVVEHQIFPPFLTTAFWAVHFILGRTLQSIGFAMLLMQSILMPRWGFYSLLNTSAACLLGVLSYSLYIWHQLFFTKVEVFGLGPVWWMSHPFWPISAVVVAFISYYGLERPLLNLRHRFR